MGMEAPKTNENTENMDDGYREKRDAGYGRAQEKIQNIDGFDKMDYREQFSTLAELIKTAKDEYEENFIAAHMEHMKIEMKKEDLDNDLKKIEDHYGIAA